MKKLLMKRSIQSYFMSSKQWWSLWQKGKSERDFIQKNLNSKYLTGMDYYNVKVVNDVIYNDTTHLVSVFKDYLIFDDISEFLKRSYNKDESVTRLNKIYAFYDKYSKVFPNYIILEENKYMFKNIERKQIAIDERQQFFQELEEKEKHEKKDEKKSNISNLFGEESNWLFNTKFLDSVKKIKTNSQVSESFPFDFVSRMLDSHIQNSGNLEESKNKSKAIRLEDSQLSNLHKKAKIIPYKKLEDYNIAELVEKFLLKDSNILDSETDKSNTAKVEKQNAHSRVNLRSQMYTENMNNLKSSNPQKKAVFNYQEMKTKYGSNGAKTNRIEYPNPPLKQNFMVVHRKTPTEIVTTQPDKNWISKNTEDLKAQYAQMRKQKRPKSSEAQWSQKPKSCSKKPVIFSTIDNRKPAAYLSQKYLYEHQQQTTPSTLLKSPSLSPKEVKQKNFQNYEVLSPNQEFSKSTKSLKQNIINWQNVSSKF